MNPLLSGLSFLYDRASRMSNAWYDSDFSKAAVLNVPVISLGNLTVGGTGKTPLADFCLQRLKAQKIRPGLVCRSYRASLKKPEKVDVNRAEGASIYGDEALLLARRHPDVPVYSGPDKTRTAQLLSRQEKVDILVVDDGFQHRKLHRDLDLLLLDATDAFAAYQCVPAGRGRENFHGLHRADAYLMTKTNLAAPEHLKVLKEMLPRGKPVFEFASELPDLESLLKAFETMAPLVLVSAIARPESFRHLIEKQVQPSRLTELAFRDHHPYGLDDVMKIRSVADWKKAAAVLTTEKDEVKLRPLWPDSALPLIALPLNFHLKNETKEFDQLLLRARKKGEEK